MCFPSAECGLPGICHLSFSDFAKDSACPESLIPDPCYALTMKCRHGSYEYFDHAADIGVHAEADSIENLFFTCAEALLHWIGEPPDEPTEVCLDVSVESQDLEGLLVSWLQKLLFLFQDRLLYTSRFLEIDLKDTKLKGSVMARVWNQSSHENFREVKAVTYHQLRVTREGELWGAEIILHLSEN